MGTPLPSALAMVTTSGTTPSRWWANHAPQRPRPVCTSSTMKSMPRSSQSRRTPWKYSAVAGFTPPSPCTGSSSTAATDGSSARLELVEVEPGDVAEALGQRLERLVLGRLPGGVQGGEGAAVERAEGADDDVAAPAAEAAGQLERALVGLGAGVGEEHLAAQASVLGPAGLADAEEAVEGLGHLPARLGAEQVGHVEQRLGLLVQRLGDRGVAVPEAGDGEAREEVEVPAAVAVPHPGPLAAHELQRRRPVGRHERAAVERRCPHGLGRGSACDRSASEASGLRGRNVIIVPTPASLNSSSSSTCGSRPSSRWADPTPLVTAWRQAAIFGIIPPVSVPSSRSAWRAAASIRLMRLVGSATSASSPSTSVR